MLRESEKTGSDHQFGAPDPVTVIRPHVMQSAVPMSKGNGGSRWVAGRGKF
ncbi:MAG: hypothetical protein AB7P24_09700 [Nitrospira sp.]